MMNITFKSRHRLVDGMNHRQALLALMGMMLGLAIFMAIERAVVPRYSFATGVDRAIPFIPLTWIIYVLFFPFLIGASAYAESSEFTTFKSAVAIAFILSVGCFQLFPESVPRPDPSLIGNAFLRQRFTRLWEMDLATNGLPSLHVSVTCLACRMFWCSSYRSFVGAIGFLICASTLTVKQHTLVDVLAGLVLAVVCSVLVERWQRGGLTHGRA